MNAIRVASGAVFVTDGRLTVRLTRRGECQASPISYAVLEWDLRTEPPDSWEYLADGDLRALPDGGYEKICATFAALRAALRTDK